MAELLAKGVRKVTKRNKWRIVGLCGAAFFAYAYYVGADDCEDGTTGGIYRVKEPGGEWVVGIPCPEGYSGGAR